MSELRQALLRLNFPFCFQKCDFCKKDIVTGWDTRRLHECALATVREIEAAAEDFADCEIAAIRLDGGDVTALTGEDLWTLDRTVRASFSVREDAPVTLLSNPFQINGSLLAFANRIPVRRWDYEVFSTRAGDDAWLRRPDCREKLRLAGAMTHAEEEGSMGAVLVLGHPDQTPERFRRTLVDLIRTPMVHLTLWRHPAAGAAALPEEDRALLIEAGFEEYLPGCFARPGREDRYLSLRRAGAPVLAFGVGARTEFDGAYSRNTTDPALYAAHSDDFRRITVQAGPLPPDK